MNALLEIVIQNMLNVPMATKMDEIMNSNCPKDLINWLMCILPTGMSPLFPNCLSWIQMENVFDE